MRKSAFTEEQIIKGLAEGAPQARKISGTVLAAICINDRHFAVTLVAPQADCSGRRRKRAILYRLALALFVQQRDGR